MSAETSSRPNAAPSAIAQKVNEWLTLIGGFGVLFGDVVRRVARRDFDRTEFFAKFVPHGH